MSERPLLHVANFVIPTKGLMREDLDTLRKELSEAADVIDSILALDMPDGEYEGICVGEVLKWKHDGQEITYTGEQAINIPVTFEIVNGRVVESAILPDQRRGK